MAFEEYHDRIKSLKDIHKDDRCFIIACGPSIRNQDLKKLENEIVIGVNASFYIRDKYNINFKYYVVSDYGVTWRIRYERILGLNTILFLAGPAASDYLRNIDKYKKIQKCEVIIINEGEKISDNDYKWTSKDLTKGALRCRNIPAAMALPLSYYLGFKETYLLGVDCDYSMKDNYFFGGKKPSRKLVDAGYWEIVGKEYKSIEMDFEKAGRKLYNATLGGKLKTLKRKSLDEIEW